VVEIEGLRGRVEGIIRDIVDTDYILEKVLSVIVGGFLAFGEEMIQILNLAVEPIINIPGIIAESLLSGFGPAGNAVLEVYRSLDAAVWTVASNAGPAAPMVVATIYVGIMVLVYRLAVSVAGEIPLMSTTVDFLGLR